MPFISTILYSNSPTLSFNMSHYLTTHMPLVYSLWSKRGLQSWTAIQLQPQAGPDGTTTSPPYAVQATMVWDSAESAAQAWKAEESQAILDDLKNYCNQKPIVFGGDVVGGSLKY